MSLDKVMRAARNQGSDIPMGLLPEGFYAWPEESAELSMINIRAYLRRGEHGIEEVGPSHRNYIAQLQHDVDVGEARQGAAANAASYGLGRARGPMPGLQTGGLQAHAEHFAREAQEFRTMDWWHKRHSQGLMGPVDHSEVNVDKGGSVFSGPGLDKAPPTGPDAEGEYLGKVERRGMLWHAEHADGTDPNDGGGKATKSLAVKSLVDYHNQMAGKYKSSKAKTQALEHEAVAVDTSQPLQARLAATYSLGKTEYTDPATAKKYSFGRFARKEEPAWKELGPHGYPAGYGKVAWGRGAEPMSHAEAVEELARTARNSARFQERGALERLEPAEAIASGMETVSKYGGLEPGTWSDQEAKAIMAEVKEKAFPGGLSPSQQEMRAKSDEELEDIARYNDEMEGHWAFKEQQRRAAERKAKPALKGIPAGGGQLAMFSGQQASALERLLSLAGFTNADEVVGLAWNPDSRHVRTAEGVRMYHAPIGTLITEHMRSAARRITSEADESMVHGKQGKGLPRPSAPAGEAQPARAARKAASAAAGAAPGHPDQVSGHRVRSVYTHPQSEHALYDLGKGLHAEGRPGESPGPVMRSQTGLQQGELEGKGWRKLAPAAKTSGAGAVGVPAPGSRARSPLAERSRAAGVNPYDINKDWVPPGDDKWIPDMLLDLGHGAEGFKPLSSKGRVKGAGTSADPIDVKGNIERALDLMRQGKHVRLNQPVELTLLMQQVRQHVQESEALPKDQRPDWDFGLLTVRGTNLFTAQHKGIPRIGMPQFSGVAQPGTKAAKIAGGAGKYADLSEELAADLKAKGIKVTRATVPAATLRATQTELVGSKVSGMAGAYLRGDPDLVKKIDNEPIYVTRDHYVVDGHHRWAAKMLVDAVDGKLGNDTSMPVRIIDMDIGAMIPYSNDFAQRMGIAPKGAVSKATKTAAPARPSAPKAPSVPSRRPWPPREPQPIPGAAVPALPGGEVSSRPPSRPQPQPLGKGPISSSSSGTVSDYTRAEPKAPSKPKAAATAPKKPASAAAMRWTRG